MCRRGRQRAREDDREGSAHAGSQKGGDGGVEHVALDQLVEAAERDPRELADVHQHVPVAGHVAVDDVQPGTGVELRILEALGRIELAVGARCVVHDLGQGAEDVIVVVEDLVVVARRPVVALDEDRLGGVHHDLPEVMVNA